MRLLGHLAAAPLARAWADKSHSVNLPKTEGSRRIVPRTTSASTDRVDVAICGGRVEAGGVRARRGEDQKQVNRGREVLHLRPHSPGAPFPRRWGAGQYPKHLNGSYHRTYTAQYGVRIRNT